MDYLLLFLLGFLYPIQSEKINIQPLSPTRFFFGTTSLQSEGLVFFAGGLSTPEYIIYDNIDIFDAKKNIWTTSILSQPRFFISSTSLNTYNLAFFAGGIASIDFIFSNIIDIYDASSKKWLIANLSIARNFIAATSLDKEGLAFFAGGSTLTQELSIIDIYNASSKKMSVSYLSIARDSIAATSLIFHGLAFFAGGDGLNGNTYSTIDIFNANTNKWSVSQLSLNRTYIGATSLPYQGLVFFAGGSLFQFVNSATNIIDIYNISNNLWTIAYLSSPKLWVGVTSLPKNGLAFFGGGYNFIEGYSFVNIPSEEIDVYDAINNKWYTSLFDKEYQTISATSLENYGLVFYAGYNKNIVQSPVYVFSSCGPGYYNNTLTTDNKICESCSLGTYSYIAATQCAMCPPGFYCNNIAISKPFPTIAGCYNPFQGSIFFCEYVCQPGNYCPLGSSQQTQCPQGTYCDVVQLAAPKSCPSGTYNQNIGSYLSSYCLTCPSGTYCNLNQSATNIIPCPAGYFCQKGSTNYFPCSPGYYCPFATNYELPCPKGSYCPTSSSVPLTCPSGYYCPALCNIPIPCLGGQQCPAGSSDILVCPKNTYSSPQSGGCTLCPDGQFTYDIGQAECLVCPVSKINFDGWHCMNTGERLIFAGGWVISIFSICASAWKIRRWIRHRKRKLIDNEIPITMKNIFFYRKNNNRVPLIERSFFNDAERMKYLEESIFELKQEVEKIKNK